MAQCFNNYNTSACTSSTTSDLVYNWKILLNILLILHTIALCSNWFFIYLQEDLVDINKLYNDYVSNFDDTYLTGGF